MTAANIFELGGDSAAQAWRTLGPQMKAESDRLRDAIGNALYFLNPNQGEPVDASAASMWLRTTLPETHPNHLDVEYVVEKVGAYV